MSSIREIKEGRQEQGANEIILYTLTVPSTWGTPTGTPTVTAFSVIAGAFTNVTATVFPSGAASVAGQVITLPLCRAMTMDVTYMVKILFSVTEGGTKEAYAWIYATR